MFVQTYCRSCHPQLECKEDIDKIAKVCELAHLPRTAHGNRTDQGSVTEHVYMCLLKLYEKYEDQGLRGRILQCLGTHFQHSPLILRIDAVYLRFFVPRATWAYDRGTFR